MSGEKSEKLAIDANKAAIVYLKEGELNKCYDLLKKAENALITCPFKNSKQLLGTTWNNLGCFYKKTENYNAALYYFRKSLEIGIKESVDPGNIASTHLNMCTILSRQGNHEPAIGHAKQAMEILIPLYDKRPELIANLVLSYFNAAVEYEHMNFRTESIEYYKLGLEIAQKYMGAKHHLTSTLKKNLDRVMTAKRNTANRVRSIDRSISPIEDENSFSRRWRNSKYLKNIDDEDAIGNLPTSLSVKSHKNSQKNQFTMYRRRQSLNKWSSHRASPNKFDFDEFFPAEKPKYVPKIQKNFENSLDPASGRVRKNREKSNKQLNRKPSTLKIEAPKIILTKAEYEDGGKFLQDIQYRKKELYLSKCDFKKHLENVKKIIEGNLQSNYLDTQKNGAFTYHSAKLIGNPETPPRPRKIDLKPLLEQFPPRSPLSRFAKEKARVTKIQSHVRKLIAVKSYKNLKSSVVKIQSYIRMFLIRKLYKSILSAVVFIQSVYRGHRVRKNLNYL
ncbi:unnamed protein product [Blepharisma stoltei]|uniref:Photosystem I assembly protein Ycf3 n=1 Tax=Blepharisma stoltei TaxID=1481888 RepID=A0AAU9I7Y4_9CILI|nr:unnamed protein product [Blepharisma stoltei]